MPLNKEGNLILEKKIVFKISFNNWLNENFIEKI